jgi:hypothetical protein
MAFSEVSTLSIRSQTSSAIACKKLLVLGGTGFVGSAVVAAARKQGYEVVSISRRPAALSTDTGVTSISADASNLDTLRAIVTEKGPFTACLHSIGLLFDADSGLSSFNKFVSGSNSVPGQDSSYDRITRLTAFNAIDCITEEANRIRSIDKDSPLIPFVFISAAEAGWCVYLDISN